MMEKTINQYKTHMRFNKYVRRITTSPMVMKDLINTLETILSKVYCSLTQYIHRILRNLTVIFKVQ